MQVLEQDADIKGREAALAEARARQLEELREQHLRCSGCPWVLAIQPGLGSGCL